MCLSSIWWTDSRCAATLIKINQKQNNTYFLCCSDEDKSSVWFLFGNPHSRSGGLRVWRHNVSIRHCHSPWQRTTNLCRWLWRSSKCVSFLDTMRFGENDYLFMLKFNLIHARKKRQFLWVWLAVKVGPCNGLVLSVNKPLPDLVLIGHEAYKVFIPQIGNELFNCHNTVTLNVNNELAQANKQLGVKIDIA